MDHDADGSGSIYDHYLTGSANSEYASWVPSDGKTQHQLTPGKWFIMVKAEGSSNARYRLKLSGGNAYAGGDEYLVSSEDDGGVQRLMNPFGYCYCLIAGFKIVKDYYELIAPKARDSIAGAHAFF